MREEGINLATLAALYGNCWFLMVYPPIAGGGNLFIILFCLDHVQFGNDAFVWHKTIKGFFRWWILLVPQQQYHRKNMAKFCESGLKIHWG